MGAAAVIGPPLPPPPLPPPQPAITMASAKNVNIDTAYLTLVAILTEPRLVENIPIWPWSGTNRVRLVEPMIRQFLSMSMGICSGGLKVGTTRIADPSGSVNLSLRCLILSPANSQQAADRKEGGLRLQGLADSTQSPLKVRRRRVTIDRKLLERLGHDCVEGPGDRWIYCRHGLRHLVANPIHDFRGGTVKGGAPVISS